MSLEQPKKASKCPFNPSELWKSICMGTGIQLGEKERKEQHFPFFDPPFETGAYFRSIFLDLGTPMDL